MNSLPRTPIAHSIVTAAQEKNLHPVRPEQVEEIAGHGICAVLPEGTFLCGNKKLMERYGIAMENEKEISYGTEVFVAKDGVYIGCILISDTLKEDAKSAVARMKKAGNHPRYAHRRCAGKCSGCG